MADRFDLEDAIMQAWHTADDLDLFLSRYLDGAVMTEDEVSNVLIGLKEIHNLRCEKLWDIFKRVHKLDNHVALQEEMGLYDEAQKCEEITKDDAEKCDSEWLEDDFGSIWRKCKNKDCGKFVVRPGKVDCWKDDCPERGITT
jgi:hypothetical protein